jgi:hypothetical protein
MTPEQQLIEKLQQLIEAQEETLRLSKEVITAQQARIDTQRQELAGHRTRERNAEYKPLRFALYYHTRWLSNVWPFSYVWGRFD